MGQDEAAKVRNRQLIAVRLGLLIGNGEQIERNAAMGVPDRLDRRQLRRLMLESVEAVRVAEEDCSGTSTVNSHSVIDSIVRASSMKRPLLR